MEDKTVYLVGANLGQSRAMDKVEAFLSGSGKDLGFDTKYCDDLACIGDVSAKKYSIKYAGKKFLIRTVYQRNGVFFSEIISGGTAKDRKFLREYLRKELKIRTRKRKAK
jgi:hypothetical protein